MNKDEDSETTANVKSDKPDSLVVVDSLNQLVAKLENKLRPVLKGQNSPKETVGIPQEKSDLMAELGYLENRIKDLLSRLHL